MFWLCWHWKLFSFLFLLFLFSCLFGGCHTIHELFWSSSGKKTFAAKIESTLFCCCILILDFFVYLSVFKSSWKQLQKFLISKGWILDHHRQGLGPHSPSNFFPSQLLFLTWYGTVAVINNNSLQWTRYALKPIWKQARNQEPALELHSWTAPSV